MFMILRFPANAPQTTGAQSQDFDKMTVTQLKAYLDSQSITYQASDNKAKLIALAKGSAS